MFDWWARRGRFVFFRFAEMVSGVHKHRTCVRRFAKGRGLNSRPASVARTRILKFTGFPVVSGRRFENGPAGSKWVGNEHWPCVNKKNKHYHTHHQTHVKGNNDWCYAHFAAFITRGYICRARAPIVASFGEFRELSARFAGDSPFSFPACHFFARCFRSTTTIKRILLSPPPKLLNFDNFQRPTPIKTRKNNNNLRNNRKFETKLLKTKQIIT